MLHAEHSSQPRILIIDDAPSSVRMLSLLVQALGEVHVAETGEEGLLAALRLRPDLILLDVEMPGMGGLATCGALRRSPELAGVPVIFITAHGEIDVELACFAAGAVDFISKPFSEPAVRARCSAHLTLKRQSDQLRMLAMRDGLTGLFNRRAFDARMDEEWGRHRRTGTAMGLAIIDIDHFKAFNDCFGHLAGDDCLRRVAQSAEAGARRAGEFVARYGGEEFAAILPGCTEADALHFAERVVADVRALAMPHPRSAAGVVTVSVGVAACLPEGEAEPGTLVVQADGALYLAKRSGRDRACAAAHTRAG